MIKRINSKSRMLYRSNNKDNQPLNYYCMACGAKHNEAACPKCGSKTKRVG
ncbi:MAG: hydrogenase maturation nickel metallochaperone HypA [Thermoproteota archaeon]|nr:hydrogenase maturation nickel metallochaperone HypA [Thermoproteota archaeon]